LGGCPFARRKKGGSPTRGLIAKFLNFYPQYTLRNLSDGTLTLGEFVYLGGGMLDVLAPESTEPFEDKVESAVKASHLKARKGL
jgi:hypothetical protein